MKEIWASIPSKMWCHGLVKDEAKVEMRLLHKNITKVGEYRLDQRPPGYPKQTRTNWTVAALDVQDANVANADAMARNRELHSTLVREGSSVLAPSTSVLTLSIANPATKRGKKQPRDEVKCTTKTKWSTDQIKRPVSAFDGHYKELQEECKEHGISQNGTTKAMIERLRNHYAEPHVDASRRARTMALANFFKKN